MSSAAVKRIEDARIVRSVLPPPPPNPRIVRSVQFLEDGGPFAHPIRPESYLVMDNFYTVTVYNKGAEVSFVFGFFSPPLGPHHP